MQLVESRLPLIETLISKNAIEHSETTQLYFITLKPAEKN